MTPWRGLINAVIMLCLQKLQYTYAPRYNANLPRVLPEFNVPVYVSLMLYLHAYFLNIIDDEFQYTLYSDSDPTLYLALSHVLT